jgi:hypothetical protein
MTTPEQLIEHLKTQPVDFTLVMEVIDQHYDFTPTAFKNGDTFNEAGQNNGSCKVFAFAKLHGLDEQSALHAFGDYYAKDVLQNPDGDDHANIRNFMQYGWKGVEFDGKALTPKAAG